MTGFGGIFAGLARGILAVDRDGPNSGPKNVFYYQTVGVVTLRDF
jgi:hypothetical protein